VNEPDVAKRVSAISSLAIGLAGSSGLAMGHAERSADLQLGVDGLDGAEGLALRDIDDVRGTHAFGEILARWGVNAPGVAEKRENPRFVENAPVGDAVAESANDNFGVVREARGEIPIGPAAGVFQFLREIPMVERAERTDFCFEERVAEALVVVEALGIRSASASSLDARPRNRETVTGQI
jgi:hypothetical protein